MVRETDATTLTVDEGEFPDVQGKWSKEKREEIAWRDKEIQQLVVEEMEKEARSARRERNAVGDTVSAGGDRMFIVQRTSEMMPGTPGYEEWLQ